MSVPRHTLQAIFSFQVLHLALEPWEFVWSGLADWRTLRIQYFGTCILRSCVLLICAYITPRVLKTVCGRCMCIQSYLYVIQIIVYTVLFTLLYHHKHYHGISSTDMAIVCALAQYIMYATHIMLNALCVLHTYASSYEPSHKESDLESGLMTFDGSNVQMPAYYNQTKAYLHGRIVSPTSPPEDEVYKEEDTSCHDSKAQV